VEIPRLLWLVILHGIILRVRPAKSAAKYATVWTPAGSPLAVHTAAQADIIAGRMKTIAPDLIVTHAMNYGQPSLKVALDDLVRTQGVDKLLVVPLFPQYSATTTGSIFDVVCNAMIIMTTPLTLPHWQRRCVRTGRRILGLQASYAAIKKCW
jgi:ferrochelatase